MAALGGTRAEPVFADWYGRVWLVPLSRPQIEIAGGSATACSHLRYTLGRRERKFNWSLLGEKRVLKGQQSNSWPNRVLYSSAGTTADIRDRPLRMNRREMWPPELQGKWPTE